MDLKILTNAGITKLEVSLLDSEIEQIVREMNIFEASEFKRLWNGNLIEKYRALNMIIREAKLNEKASFVYEVK